jgi:hypothetical protein
MYSDSVKLLIAEGEGLTVELTGMIFMSFRWMLSAKPL